MLDIKYIQEHRELVEDSIRRRGMTDVDIDNLLRLYSEFALATAKRDEAFSVRNRAAKAGKPTAAEIEERRRWRTHADRLEQAYQSARSAYMDVLRLIPNVIADGTPDGDEKHNQEISSWGEPSFDFEPKDHLQLNESLKFVDFEAGAKVAGSRFYFLRDRGVRLWMAIVQLTTDMAREHGYELMMVPHMVNTEVADGTGFLPRGEERQIYQIDDEDLNLIATSEMPLTGFMSGQTIELTDPIKFAGISSCYRREAGTYGKFSKGLFRVHQFEKLELYVFCKPDQSEQILEDILTFEEKLCQALEIPYRIVRIAAGDLSAPAFKKYDIEYYSPVDDGYRELTSCSNCTDYQARRLTIRYNDDMNKKHFVHTLNGTAATSSRTLVSLLENHQTKDGQVRIPKALQCYYGGETL